MAYSYRWQYCDMDFLRHCLKKYSLLLEKIPSAILTEETTGTQMFVTEFLSDCIKRCDDGFDDYTMTALLPEGAATVTLQENRDTVRRLSTRYHGEYAALLPEANYTGISRKITDSAERSRLKKIADEVTNGAAGAVMRTNAAGMPEEVLRADLQQLMADWQIIQARAKLARSPQVLHRELDISVRIVRDYLNACIDEVVVDSPAVYGRLQELLQNIAESRSCKLLLHDKQTDIFSYYRLSDDIASISDRRIDLPSGGYLVIDYTEAMTVIDVNSGHFSGRENLAETVMQINREAADEIARQLRLRDIGGIIVVDFIDMDKKEYREEIMERLQQALRADKMKPCVQDMTVLNLVEITRKKARQNLSAVLYAPCPVCQGSGRVQSQETVGLEIKRRLRTLLAKPCAPRSILIMVSPWLARIASAF